MNQLQKTTIAMAVAQMALMAGGGAAWAQSAPAPQGQVAAAAAPAVAAAAPAAAQDSASTPDQAAAPDASVVVVTGQRGALNSAQKIKQNSDEIVDSIVADDMGKLPDRSVTEALQRVVGVTIDRTMAKGDPEHYSVEGSGVSIRGLSYVRSELNGRDSFSANGGRALNFEDVPPELMAGVDVYKNPSAEQIEGAIGGLVNLRTAMPFDYKGFKSAVSVEDSYSELKKGKPTPSMSVLVSDRWKTPIGDVGALFDLAYSESATRTDAFQVEPYYPRTDVVPGQTVWIPKGAEWRTLDFDRKRTGAYGALQWRPSTEVDSSLTFFKSRYKMQWDEHAIFAQSNPYNIQVSPNATYSASGALLTGTLTDPADSGINFGDDTRSATRNSDTTDISWKLQWRPTSQWTLTSDLQHIRATTNSFDSTVATGVQMPKENIDLTGSIPKLNFDSSDLAYLANPNNYYWAFTMEHMDQSVATEKAWKGDARYVFDDPVLRDVSFGLRLTQRDADTVNSNPSYNWSAITQPWQLGWDITSLAYLGDPRFSGNTNLHSFTNFFNGQVSVPAVVFPNVSLTTGFPGSYATLHNYVNQLCVSGNTCGAWTPATFGTDPAGANDQSESTQAAYSQLRFGFDQLKYPVDGNVGLRYVRTDMTAHGYTVFSSTAPTIPAGYQATGLSVPVIPSFSQAQDFSNVYHNVLPSLNLRMKVSDQLQFRLALAEGMTRPDFTQLQAYTTLSQTATTTNNPANNTVIIDNVNQSGTASGNPMLKPTTSRQLDLTAEWYFAQAGSLTLALFDKQLKDVIINETYNFQIPDAGGAMQNFNTTGPINGAKGRVRGLELAYQQYFDHLPGWASGLGVQANYTFVDSRQDLYKPVYQVYCSGSAGDASNVNLNLNGCDTNGTTSGNLPLENLSRNAYNLTLLYDQGPLSARLAYSWRGKYLQAVNVNGTQGSDGTDTNPSSATYGQHVIAWGLPTWAGAFGQLDASVFYKINQQVSLGFEAQNITNAKYEQLMQQSTGLMGRAWFVSGPRYSAKLQYTF